MKATKFSYLVFAQVRDDFGHQVIGVGSHPLYVFHNENTDEIIGVVGDEFTNLKVFKNDEGQLSEVISDYIDEVGLEDFNASADMSVEKNYLTELIMATFNKDTNDFEFENEVTTILLEGASEVTDESILQNHENKYGVWLLERDGIDINFDAKGKTLTIDGQGYETLGETFNYLLSDSLHVAVLIDQ